jgi:hypothetical protein
MKQKKLIFGSTALSLVIIGIVVGLMVSQSLLAPVMPDRFWRSVRAADGDPGAGESGMLEIFIYPHQTDPNTTYQSNLTAAAAYANRSTWNGSCTGDVPYAPTKFDIVIKVRYNTTHAYNSSASAWDGTFVRANITCSDLGIAENTSMHKIHILNASDYMYVNYYVNNTVAGFNISHGQTINVTYVKIEAYY